jgi:hypothetical protein
MRSSPDAITGARGSHEAGRELAPAAFETPEHNRGSLSACFLTDTAQRFHVRLAGSGRTGV